MSLSVGAWDPSHGLLQNDLQLDAWVLAYRRLLGGALLTWEGETDIEPPRHLQHGQAALEGDWTAKGLREPQPRLLRPDAVLEVERVNGGPAARTFLIEYDRTRRVDKNYGKFRRYDAFLNGWWRLTAFSETGDPPYVVFVCQDQGHRELLMRAADLELTGHRWHPSVESDQYEYAGRERIAFARERDQHAGESHAWRLPRFPPDHHSRTPDVRHMPLAREAGATRPATATARS